MVSEPGSNGEILRREYCNPRQINDLGQIITLVDNIRRVAVRGQDQFQCQPTK